MKRIFTPERSAIVLLLIALTALSVAYMLKQAELQVTGNYMHYLYPAYNKMCQEQDVLREENIVLKSRLKMIEAGVLIPGGTRKAIRRTQA